MDNVWTQIVVYLQNINWEHISFWASDNYQYLVLLVLMAVPFRAIIKRKLKHAEGVKKIKQATEKNLNEPNTLHPEFNYNLCVGCGSCVNACPEGEIIQLIDHKPMLVTPSKCVGHGMCEQKCPQGALTLVFGTKTRGMDIPRITENYESNVAGLYIAGELGGMG